MSDPFSRTKNPNLKLIAEFRNANHLAHWLTNAIGASRFDETVRREDWCPFAEYTAVAGPTMSFHYPAFCDWAWTRKQFRGEEVMMPYKEPAACEKYKT